MTKDNHSNKFFCVRRNIDVYNIRLFVGYGFDLRRSRFIRPSIEYCIFLYLIRKLWKTLFGSYRISFLDIL